MAHHCKHFSSLSGGRLTLPSVQILPQEMARNGALPYPQFKFYLKRWQEMEPYPTLSSISTYTHLTSTSQKN
jgi:hypothetical protein